MDNRNLIQSFEDEENHKTSVNRIQDFEEIKKNSNIRMNNITN